MDDYHDNAMLSDVVQHRGSDLGTKTRSVTASRSDGEADQLLNREIGAVTEVQGMPERCCSPLSLTGTRTYRKHQPARAICAYITHVNHALVIPLCIVVL